MERGFVSMELLLIGAQKTCSGQQMVQNSGKCAHDDENPERRKNVCRWLVSAISGP